MLNHILLTYFFCIVLFLLSGCSYKADVETAKNDLREEATVLSQQSDPVVRLVVSVCEALEQGRDPLLEIVDMLEPPRSDGSKSTSQIVRSRVWQHMRQTFLEEYSFRHFVVVSWVGCTIDDPDGRIELFAQKLVPGQTIDNMRCWSDGHLQAEILLEGDNAVTPPSPEIVLSANLERFPFFKDVFTAPRLVRMFADMYSDGDAGGIRLSDRDIFQKLQEFGLIGPDGHSTVLIIALTEEVPLEKDFASVLESIKEVGRECGVDPVIQFGERLSK